MQTNGDREPPGGPVDGAVGDHPAADARRPDAALSYLLDAVTDYAIYMLDPTGRVESWNTGAQRLKGYDEAEIVGRHFSEFFSPQDRAAGVPERLLADALRDGSVESEGWRVRKDGELFWAQGTLTVVRTETGALRGFAKVTRDITEKREAQLKLGESERRFRLLVEGVVDYAIYMLDPNGVITNWNRGAQRIKGYDADEVVGRHFSLFYTASDRRAGIPAAALETALRDGRFDAEGWRVRKDGRRFWASVVIDPIYDDDGRLVGFAKITRDATERRAAEEALAESERQFRLLVSSVVDYAIFMLDPNGIVSNWNTGAQHIKGYAVSEIVGRHFSAFYTEEDRAAGVPARALKTAGEQGRYEAEGWRLRKDGTLFWALVIIDAVRDEDGRLVGFAKITRDITEKRQSQLDLQRAHQQLAQSQKLEALGKLTGGVAHDFNNLLMVVSGQAQLLRKKVGDDPRAIRALDAIETSARRGEELTRHLLSFSRRQRLTPTAFSLSERASALNEVLGAAVKASVRLEIALPNDLWPVRVDAGEFEVALLNLAVNARDAMPGGGSLTVAARNITLDGAGPGALEGDFVAVSLQDTGAGIAPDILPQVFDPFFTTKDVDKGTGLGLSQVFGFAQQSGGRVDVHSELGAGTRFTIYLPRSDHAPLPEVDDGPLPAPASIRILLVEDNPEVAEVVARMLEELGHEVRQVGNGAAALRALESGDAPDLIFSDIVMAGDPDGLGMARQARKAFPDVPILLATGYSEAAARIGDEFPILRKPYKLADLNRAIAERLANRGAEGKLVDLETARRARNPRPK